MNKKQDVEIISVSLYNNILKYKEHQIYSMCNKIKENLKQYQRYIF